MTERHSGYVVALDHDIRDDDAEAVINAIRMIKGVLSIEPMPAGSAGAWVVEERRDHAWRGELLRLAKEGPDGE